MGGASTKLRERGFLPLVTVRIWSGLWAGLNHRRKLSEGLAAMGKKIDIATLNPLVGTLR